MLKPGWVVQNFISVMSRFIEILICESCASWCIMLWLIKSLKCSVLARQLYSLGHGGLRPQDFALSLHYYLCIFLCCININRKSAICNHLFNSIFTSYLGFHWLFCASLNSFQNWNNSMWWSVLCSVSENGRPAS